LPLRQPDDKGNLPIHVIANQLMSLERLILKRNGGTQRHNYEAALVIAQKIVVRQPNFLDRVNNSNQTPIDLLKGSKNPSSLNALLCDDFDLQDEVLEQLRETGEDFLGNALLADFNKRRAEKIQQVEQLYRSLQNASVLELDSIIKSSLHLLNTENVDQQDMVRRSIEDKQIPIFRRLLENGAHAYEAIFFASSRNMLEVVRVLIDFGVDLNLRSEDYDGRTALSLAASSEHLSVVQALITAGANVNLTDDDGWSALHWAAQAGNLPVLQALIVAGADVNRTDDEGLTALYLAAKARRLPVVQALIAAGADVKKRRHDDGMTALHIASKKGHLEIVKSLLAAGADVNMMDDEGQTALDYAEANEKKRSKTSAHRSALTFFLLASL
jgi:ankyrin repeat protein